LPQEAGRQVSQTPDAPQPITRTIKAGDSVAKYAREIYGSATPAIITRIKKYNPHIKNMARIQIGDVLVFPALPSMERHSSIGLSHDGGSAR
jgi:nucleoid-associated protein YgaU